MAPSQRQQGNATFVLLLILGLGVTEVIASHYPYINASTGVSGDLFRITDLAISPKKVLSIKFWLDASVKLEDLQFLYVEYFHQEHSARSHFMCQNSACEKNNSSCSCTFNENGIKTYPMDQSYQLPKDSVFVLHVKDLGANRKFETTFVFNTMEHVYPESVRRLGVTSVYSNKAEIEFCNRKLTQRLVEGMERYGKPLVHHIVVEKDGSAKKLEFNVPASKNNRCIAFSVEQLTYDTYYTVTVYSSGGGGKGRKRSLKFTTIKTVPLHGPHVDSYAFSRVSYNDSQGRQFDSLMILWKSLSLAGQGGGNITYHLEVSSDKGVVFSGNTTKSYMLMDKFLPTGQVSVNIWAQNEMGKSSSSLLLIPAKRKRDFLAPQIQVEFSKNVAHITVNFGKIKVDGIAIHLCRGEMHDSIPGLDICEEYPATVHPKSRKINHSILTYTIKISKLFQSKKPEQGKFCYRKNLKEKRDCPFLASPSTVSGREITPRVDSSSPVQPRVFVSVLRHRRWSGMVAANCYFDRSLDQVNVNLQTMQKGGKVFVIWKQECDRLPQQFMVDRYKFFLSSSEECHVPNSRLIRVVKSKPGLVLKRKLAATAPFACVQPIPKKARGKVFKVRLDNLPEGNESDWKSSSTKSSSSNLAYGPYLLLFIVMKSVIKLCYELIINMHKIKISSLNIYSGYI